MYLVRCLVFISLFFISTSDHKVQVKGCFVGSVLPRSFRLASSVTNARCFPSSVKSPPSYKLCQRPRAHGSGGGVGFLISSSLSHRIVDHPTFTYFECLIVSIGSNAHSTLVACVYRPPGSCSKLSPCVWVELYLKTRGTCSCLTTQ